jgi:hypothetical protein
MPKLKFLAWFTGGSLLLFGCSKPSYLLGPHFAVGPTTPSAPYGRPHFREDRDCDGKVINGQEVDVRSDANNCGECGQVCAKGNPHCIDAVCVDYPSAFVSP